jgi:DNA topoisomerase-1
MIVEREREIQAFEKEEYWSITARVEGARPPEFKAKLFKYGEDLLVHRDEKKGNRFLLRDEKSTAEMIETLRQGSYVCTKVEKKERKRSPAPPFTTSTLQQEAARKLGYTAKRTMSLAQQLYEGIELGPEGSHGLITYMRTDSVRVADEAQTWVREFIENTFGKEHLPPKPPAYKSKKGAQDAHEAVRPTSIQYTPEAVKAYLGRDLQRLYSLIWNRFVASQMKPALLEQTTADMTGTPPGAQEAVLRATGSVVAFPGFMALYTETLDEAEDDDGGGILPAIKEGDRISLLELLPRQHFTQPPPRYTEASLVRTLEEKGIGRPSTYATIISTITDREYVQKDQGRFTPTELGTIVNDYLVERFSALLDVGFTARMEDELDNIEEGKFRWQKVIQDFYGPFDESLKTAAGSTEKAKPQDVSTGETCEKCGSEMVKRWGRHGWFLACSGFPKCRNTRQLEGEAQQTAQSDEPTAEVCPKCGSPMVIKTGRFGKFIACSKYPECKTTKPIPTGVKCPVDGGDLIERRSRMGKPFWSCSNYPNCSFALWQRPIPGPCPLCGTGPLVIKKDRSGKLLKACSQKECSYAEEITEETPA